MRSKERARRCGNTERANVHANGDDQILADAYRKVGWILGLAFGLMFFLGIIAG